MSLFTIDETKCTRCGHCLLDCPVRIIVRKEPGALPEPVRGAPRFCMHCGHCAAICPHGALRHQSLPGEDRPLPRGWRLNPGLVEGLLKGRRSIRAYKERPVERSVLEEIIDLAHYAPSGTNRQPVRWLVLQERASVRKVAETVMEWIRSCRGRTSSPLGPYADFLIRQWEEGADPICRNAPHLIMAKGDANPMTSVDSTIALTYLELAALPFGLGTCWAGFVHAGAVHSPSVSASLGIPEGQMCHGAVMIGFPKFSYHRIPGRKPPKVAWR